MKASFVIYLLLLLLDAVVGFQATGSPVLFVVPAAGIMLYSVLCVRPGPAAEGLQIFFCLLILVLSLMQFGGNISAILVGLMALFHFLGATQCVWEILHAQTDRDKSSPDKRLTVFSLAFYASLGFAYVLLRGDDLKLPTAHRYLLAALVVILSLIAWEMCRVLRLKRGRPDGRLSSKQLLRRILLGAGGAALVLLIFIFVLPPVSDALCSVSPKIGLPNLKDPGLTKPRPKNAPGQNPPPQQAEGTEGGGPSIDSGPEQTAANGRAKLPPRGQLRQTDAPRLAVKFDTPEDGKALAAQNALYVRCLALSAYSDGQWLPSSEEGYWTEDASDGAKDGVITLQQPKPSAIRHTVFVPGAEGLSVPALASAVELGLPKLYIMPDDWHQIRATGDIRYPARSEVKIWNPEKWSDPPRPGKPGLAYIRTPEGRLGEELQKIGQEVIRGRRAPLDVVEAVREFLASHYKYSRVVENKNNLSPLENFLLDERRGYCDHFATAGALLLRMGEIPSRVAFGYRGGVFDEKSGAHVMRQRDAHSWTEIMLEGHGWVICDFTPADPQAAAENAAQQQKKLDVNLSAFQDVAEEEKKEEQRQEEKKESESLLTQLKQMAPRIGPSALGFLGAAFILGMGVWIWLRRKEQANSPEARAKREAERWLQQPEYFREFEKMGEEFGFQREPGETLRELQSAMRSREFFHPQFEEMARYHYRVRFEDMAEDPNTESEWIKMIRSVRRERREMEAERRRAGPAAAPPPASAPGSSPPGGRKTS